ncbi:MAG TPA: immunoglobulin domain-containing protein [Verrucomicrobiota bacterium]|nr:immunoglobulin domain-containing protein [Verrucomicrobiota bacterium]
MKMQDCLDVVVHRLLLSCVALVPSGVFHVRLALPSISRAWVAAILVVTIGASTATAQTVVSWGVVTNPPPSLGPTIAVAAGTAHSLALQADGTLAAWGSSPCGQTNVPDGLENVVAIAAGEDHSLALKSDGSLVAWGCETPWDLTRVPAGATNVTQIAAGRRHSLALRSDGTVLGWGDNGEGECDPPEDLRAVAVATGGRFSLALRKNGTVAAWGGNFFGQCRPPPGLGDVVAVAAGDNHALALRADGTVIGWGDNSCGQCDVPPDLSAVSAISAGASYCLALRADGTVAAWGQAAAMQPPPDLANVVAIAAGGDSAVALVGADGIRLVRTAHDRDALLGTDVAMTAAVHGAAPISFQWYKDGQRLSDNGEFSGTATQSLLIRAARFEDAGEYWLVASNVGGTLVTPPARLVVFAAPRIESNPEPQSLAIDSTALLSVSALGAEPLSYQWRKDGTPLVDGDGISGTALRELRIEAVTFENAGGYSVVVSNAHGSATSQVAQVTVAQVAGWGANWCGELDIPAGLTGVVKVAAGEAHALALREDGTMIAWGDNLHGQCDVPAGLRDAVAIAAGGFHSLALRRNGNVVGWGYSKGGLLDVPPELDSVTAIAAGMGHSIALRGDGTVRCWGPKDTLNAEVAAALREIVGIACGGRHSIALKANGTVFSWGGSDFLDPPPGLNNVIAVAAGVYHSLALRSDGTVVGWGIELARTSFPSSVAEGLSNVVQVAAGPRFSVALKGDGTVVAWGSNHSGESRPPPGLHNVVAIAANGGYGLALKGDGRPFILGQSVSRKAVLGEHVLLQASVSGTAPLACAWLKDGLPMSDGSGITGARESTLNIAQVSYADEGVYTLTVSNGLGSATSGPITLSVIQVLGWGDDAFGQTDAPRGTRDVVALASGDSHTVALHTDGSISAWGEGGDGQTDTPHETAVAIATGGFHNLALRPDGTVMAWGRNRSGQCDVPPDLADVVAIAAGRAHSLALRADGTVVGWGRTLIPPGLNRVRSIAAGACSSVALREDGEVVAWGQNRHGECFTPPVLTNVVRIAAGGYHYLALCDDGTVVAWGLNSSGQCNVPADLNNAVAIAAGTHHSVALRSDGSVVSWGSNQSGQCHTPAVAPKARTVAAGRVHSLAVAADGRPEFVRPVLVESIQGGAVRLTGFVLGEGPVGFQWYWNDQALVDDADINGAQTASVVMQSAAALPGLYSLRVTNALGEALTAPVSLSGALGPRVRLLAHTRELLRASRVRLAADVEGTEPIALQWLLNGVPLTEEPGLSGTAGSVLEIEAVEPRHAGIYQLSAANAYGTAVSAGVDLSVCNVRAWGDKRRGQSLLPYSLRGVKQISALADHALALRWDGTIEAWGDNSHSQCVVPLALSNVIQVAAGGTHSIALSGDGVVTVWGADRLAQPLPASVTNISAIAAGEPVDCYAYRRDGCLLWWHSGYTQTNTGAPDILGSEPITGGAIRSSIAQQALIPNTLRAVGAFLDIAPGRSYHHAVMFDGGVKAWASGGSPIEPFVFPLTNVVTLATGVDQPCLALSADSQVMAWKAGQTGSVTHVESASGSVGVAVGSDFYLALTGGGDVLGWGGIVLPPPNLDDVVELAAGGGHALARRVGGEVVAWGDNRAGQCIVPDGLSNVVALAAGFAVPGKYAHSMALQRDGTVVAWGDNSGSQCQVPASLKEVVAIAAGAGHSVALKADGAVVAWGTNQYRQCNVPTNLLPVVAIAAGYYHSAALLYDGTVVCWGANGSGQCDVPAGLSEVVQIGAGKSHTVALRCDGGVSAWGDVGAGAAEVGNWSNIIAIAAGGLNTAGVKGDGTIVVAGNNDYGQAEVPPELKNVSSVAAGDDFVLAAVGEGPLAGALGDGGDFRWRTGGELPWVAQMLVTQDGKLAAQSAELMPGEESWLETGVHGPGTLRFWWRTASASDQDALELELNGATVARVTGNTEWEPGRLAVHSGSSTVRWRYIRAAASTQGAPAAWLDEVTFEPAPGPALVIIEAEDSQITVRCESVQGLFYTLQSAFTLEGERTEWETVETLVGTDLPLVFAQPLGMEHAEFFRVLVE